MTRIRCLKLDSVCVVRISVRGLALTKPEFTRQTAKTVFVVCPVSKEVNGSILASLYDLYENKKNIGLSGSQGRAKALQSNRRLQFPNRSRFVSCTYHWCTLRWSLSERQRWWFWSKTLCRRSLWLESKMEFEGVPAKPYPKLTCGCPIRCADALCISNQGRWAIARKIMSRRIVQASSADGTGKIARTVIYEETPSRNRKVYG